jgi:hypothetical protein
MEIIQIIFAISFIFSFALDLSIFPYVVNKNYISNNKYYLFHQKYGVVRTTILKLLFGLFVIIGLIHPPFNVGEFYLIVIIYLVYLYWAFIALYKAYSGDRKRDQLNRPNNLDSIVGFFAYPFEYLDSDKPIFNYKEKGIKWSWGAFILPEYWFFKNELLGAGYISWLLLFLYVGLLFSFGFSAIVVLLVIRIIFGLTGQKVYFLKYGNYVN